MTKLGKKFNHKVKMLGRKTDHTVHKLGQKTNNVLDKIENANKKCIQQANKGIHVANKVLDVGDKVLHVANKAGLRNVPLVGTATSLLETGLHEGHRGTAKLAKASDKYEKVSKNVLKKGRKAGNELEKVNTRKAITNAMTSDSGDHYK